MYGRTTITGGGGGLDRFKKAQSLQPFSVAAPPPPNNNNKVSHHHSPQSQLQPNKEVGGSTQLGGGQSSWLPPDWAIEPRPGVYFLDVFKDGHVLDKINLHKRRHIFGRQLHTCDFVLDHQSVSRQHAAVVPHKNGSVYVIDLGSAHGTFVANERLTKDSPVELEVGQSLRFAASTRVYILKKDNAALFPPPLPTSINLPPPPDPSDDEAVLAYNTFVNRYTNLSEVSSTSSNHETETRPFKRSKKTRVAFRDQVGGELVEVVGVSDGADVETEPGPMGVKEGSSLVGKYESLVQTTVIPKGKEISSSVTGGGGGGGVTDKLQQVLNKVKAPPPPPSKGGIYDDLYGGVGLGSSSWAYSGGPAAESKVFSAVTVRQESNDDSDDDLFG
ncbi:Forkhead-associated (FHA) domain-containing protein [Artemisia annua]|uniref:Forkhead-associated (FHA) domain-containing protein n=1 Tax=Artemisia annua TaxID=35608 RepID=A0A2U1Q1M9_ARTAN|nr:Forkhead-associated (FHA) domain-containing protein [Artemisia annua]